jgi:hypothetical protein
MRVPGMLHSEVVEAVMLSDSNEMLLTKEEVVGAVPCPYISSTHRSTSSVPRLMLTLADLGGSRKELSGRTKLGPADAPAALKFHHSQLRHLDYSLART